MNKKLKILGFLFLIFSLSNLTYGQVEQEEKALVQILLELEKKHNIKFSFETKILEDLSITPLASNLSLKETINQLNLVTNLHFKILSDRFIAISIKNKLGKLNSIQQLNEVVISNYLTKGISKINNGIIRANPKAFDILPGLIEPDVLQIVQSLPGIISVDERVSNINVRGGTNDQNLIIYEGIRMYQSGHFFGLISAFNPYLAEDITISKNGTSARYGNAVSSTIAIKNTDELDQKNRASIGGNLLSIDGFTKVALTEKTEIQVSARRSYTDVLVTETYDAYFNRIFRDSELNESNTTNTQLALDERFFFYDFNAKFLYDIDDTSKFRLNLLTISNNLDYNQAFITSEHTLQETRSELNQENQGASANYSKLVNRNLKLSAQAYYSHYDLDATNKNTSNNTTLQQENKVEDFGLRLDITKTVNDDLNFNGGYQFNDVSVTYSADVTNPNYTSLNKEIIRTHSLFGEIEWYSPTRDTHIRLGSRINYFSKLSDFLIEPRFSINYKFLDYFRLEVLGELKSQSITQIIDLQQDFFGIEKRRWQLANGNDVPLITSEQLSLGLSYNQNNLLISLEGYYKSVNNITAKSQGFQNQFQFTNDIGNYSVKGLDFLINKRFNEFSTWLGYTWSKNDYTFNALNANESFPNTLDIRHVANASITYNIDRLKIGLGLNWHSGRPYTSALDIQDNSSTIIAYSTPNNARLSDYFRTDISAIYDFSISEGIDAQLGASVWNLFNQSNIINRYYSKNQEGEVEEVNNQSLQLTPNLSFRINF